MSSVTQIPNAVDRPQSKQCCDQISEALGRCWIWIVKGWHWCVDKVFRVVDAVAFGFFRVVGCFAPNLALKMEAGYGYLATWYARHKAAAAQKISQTTITDLEAVNRGLNKDVLQKSCDLSELQVKHTQVLSERGKLSAERDGDIRARADMHGQYQQMQQEVLMINARSEALKAENKRLQEQVQGMIGGRAPILMKNDELSDALGNLQRENEILQMRMKYVIEERDIAYSMVQLCNDLRDQSIQTPKQCQSQNAVIKNPSCTAVVAK